MTTPPAVQEHLDGLEPARRQVVEQVRDVVLRALPPGYEESLAFGMITWSVPLARFPDTYDGQPLGYVALASMKRHLAVQAHEVERERWEQGARRLRTLEDLDLGLVAEAVASTGVEDHLALYACSRQR